MGPIHLANQGWEEPMSEAKPFVISKWEVMEAYKRVKANQGAAGVDEESIGGAPSTVAPLCVPNRRRFPGLRRFG